MLLPCRLHELEGPPESVQLKPAMIMTHIEHHERYTSVLASVLGIHRQIYSDIDIMCWPWPRTQTSSLDMRLALAYPDERPGYEAGVGVLRGAAWV